MAKLHFRYGSMNSGKTAILIQTAFNYEERGQKVLIIKPGIDTKGNDTIVSRIGVSRKVDYLINNDDSVIDTLKNNLKNNLKNINCILVDEVQFMTRKQIEELWYITKVFNIPVIGYGLRTDFKTNGFEGSIRMFELADELLEMPTICRCGKKARFNGRLINNEYVYDGDSICIDDKEDVTYESLCGSCYLKKVRKISRDDF